MKTKWIVFIVVISLISASTCAAKYRKGVIGQVPPRVIIPFASFDIATEAGHSFLSSAVSWGDSNYGNPTAALDIGQYDGRKLTLIDSAGKKLVGYIKQDNTGLTLDNTNLITNGGFSTDTSSWVADGDTILTSVIGGYAGNCLQLTGPTAIIHNSHQILTGGTLTNGAIYYGQIYTKSGTSGDEIASFFPENATSSGGITYASMTTSGAWANMISTGAAAPFPLPFPVYKSDIDRVYIQKTGTTIGTMLFDEVTLQKVLHPKVFGNGIDGQGGCKIVTQSGGSTESWLFIDAGFDLVENNTVRVVVE